MSDDLKALLREASKELKHLAELVDDSYKGRSWEVLAADGDDMAKLPRRIDDALAGHDDHVALADIAGLQRYSLATIGVIDGVDHGAEMEEDDEGEFILLADIFRLKEKACNT
jgi:hypothetical protein